MDGDGAFLMYVDLVIRSRKISFVGSGMVRSGLAMSIDGNGWRNFNSTHSNISSGFSIVFASCDGHECR